MNQCGVEIGRRAGGSDVIDCGTQDFVAATLDLTGGNGVDVVYDAVGCMTIDGSFTCLADRGRLVNFGQASAPAPPVEMTRLFAKSLRIGRPNLFHYIETPNTLTSLSERIFAAVSEGRLRPPAPKTSALEDAGATHEGLESRATGGPPVLVPQRPA